MCRGGSYLAGAEGRGEGVAVAEGFEPGEGRSEYQSAATLFGEAGSREKCLAGRDANAKYVPDLQFRWYFFYKGATARYLLDVRIGARLLGLQAEKREGKEPPSGAAEETKAEPNSPALRACLNVHFSCYEPQSPPPPGSTLPCL